MFLETLDLTTALRPELSQDEALLFVQDAVGLYEGKFKIPSYQNGHVYLTTHRICYVDNAEPRKNSTAIELKNVDKYEFYAGFMRSSPKITLYPRPGKRSSIQLRNGSSISGSQASSYSPSRSATASPLARSASPYRGPSSLANTQKQPSATWICPICSFSNPVPVHFDPTTANAHTPLPPCLTCGIKPELALVLKAAISSASRRQQALSLNGIPSQPLLETHQQYNGEAPADYAQSNNPSGSGRGQKLPIRCPRCTFENHPSLTFCEICNAPLTYTNSNDISPYRNGTSRSVSPGPSLDGPNAPLDDTPEYIKISFRDGGGESFHEKLKGAMIQRRWLLLSAPMPQYENPFDTSLEGLDSSPGSSGVNTPNNRSKGVGIAGLERRGLELRKKNERMIGNAFEDLDTLRTFSKEILAVADSFANKWDDTSTDAKAIISESAASLGMVTTRAMLGTSASSDSLYISELSRNLAEYLTDDRQGILKKEGGIMSLVDLWAVFNQASNGIELNYPPEFEKAARLWEKLGLPVRLREFRNGLLVVQRYDWTDDKSIAQLLAWFQNLRLSPPRDGYAWDWSRFGKGVTAQEAAAQFGWSVGVAMEELEMAEEKGALCREESIEGVRFWENWLIVHAEGNIIMAS
ncbi:hypothetical protein MMC27_006118 [Xylographa pallens]|nr:hypothetical protein [Xylographa pallens]